ncbi:polysaccharide biosynthesis/export family protein [Pseudaestuariivita sp.]|uniref:polysaccharide biosynthesis/export family protein n=1 Tax=Pseudaestuariivita sp. TaxID=2211669 RepID=UPI0040589CBE
MPTVDLVQVTRAQIPVVSAWPVTGWKGHYRWLAASHGYNARIVRPGDRIDLVIWDSQLNSLLTSEAEKAVRMDGLEVSSGGAIFVPYINTVKISGLTPDQARRRIQTRLQPVVPSAQVQLNMSAGVGNSVDLVSGVGAPGSYPMPNQNFSVLGLIAKGGGISDALRNPLVRLIRGSKTFEIRADTLFASADKNTRLVGGDKVIVTEDERSFMAIGASGKEDLIYFPKDHVTALEAVSLMGGLLDARADPKGLLVLREYPLEAVRSDGSGPTHPHVIFSFDLTTADGLFAARNFEINPNDTVLATEAPAVQTRAALALFGAVLGANNAIQAATN